MPDSTESFGPLATRVELIVAVTMPRLPTEEDLDELFARIRTVEESFEYRGAMNLYRASDGARIDADGALLFPDEDLVS